MARLGLAVLAGLMLAVSTAVAQPITGPTPPAPIPLWPGVAPGSEGKTGDEKVMPIVPGGKDYYRISSVHTPAMYAYLPPKEKASGAAIIILPGGGHRELAIGHEGFAIGEFLAAHGVAGFVVKYRLAREQGSTYTIEDHEFADVKRAIRTVRSKAADWNVNPDAIGVIGFSAGGELAAMLATREIPDDASAADPIDRLSAKPNFQVLMYPAIPQNMTLSRQTPPAFLACGESDRQNISQGLPQLYLQMKEVGMSAELHVYAKTGHGFGLRPSAKPPVSEWPMQLQQWMVNIGVIPKDKAS
jgi:endo-1,4-beta-xylanase